MLFPWRRYWQRAGIVFVVALALNLVLMALVNSGRLTAQFALIALIDSVVLAIVLAFPLTQPINRGPH